MVSPHSRWPVSTRSEPSPEECAAAQRLVGGVVEMASQSKNSPKEGLEDASLLTPLVGALLETMRRIDTEGQRRVLAQVCLNFGPKIVVAGRIAGLSDEINYCSAYGVTQLRAGVSSG